jgi:DNA invertase Pin-like site-specific DNA recombinase
MFGKNHSDESKQKMSDAKKGNTYKKGKPRASEAGKPSQQIEVTDIKNNITTSYNSISEAARTLNINNATIVKYFSNNQQSPYKGRYTFKKLN